MKLPRIILLISFILYATQLLSNSGKGLPVGDWKIHRPAKHGQLVELAGNRVYCLTKNTLFYYDKEFNNVKTLTKVDGLSGINPTAMDYSDNYNTLVIGYESGNIDLLKGNTITNIDAIVRSSMNSSLKLINEIKVEDHRVFISGKFGLAILDLRKKIISESFLNIGKDGSQISVFSSAFMNDSLYINSEEGLKVGNLQEDNLLDFNSWTKIELPDSLQNNLSKNI